MPVYAVFGLSNPNQAKKNIVQTYPGAYYDAGNGVFFIASNTETTIEVGNRIGFGNDNRVLKIDGIIVPVTNYWGRYNTNVWEWIAARQISGA